MINIFLWNALKLFYVIENSGVESSSSDSQLLLECIQWLRKLQSVALRSCQSGYISALVVKFPSNAFQQFFTSNVKWWVSKIPDCGKACMYGVISEKRNVLWFHIYQGYQFLCLKWKSQVKGYVNSWPMILSIQIVS